MDFFKGLFAKSDNFFKGVFAKPDNFFKGLFSDGWSDRFCGGRSCIHSKSVDFGSRQCYSILN